MQDHQTNDIFVAPEDLAEFRKLGDSIVAELAPASALQAEYVRTIIHSMWTIRRTRVIERKMQQRAYAEGTIDPMLDTAWARQLKGVLDMRRQAERSQIQAFKDLNASRASGSSAPKPQVLKAAAASASSVAAAPEPEYPKSFVGPATTKVAASTPETIPRAA
jgi:hypothetical protein